MSKIIKIENCKNCPYCEPQLVSGTWQHYCKLSKKIINGQNPNPRNQYWISGDINTIQDWCELKDEFQRLINL